MAQYIDKDRIVAEIERRKQEAESNCGGYKSYEEHRCNACTVDFYEEFLEIINTLEVKEVNLEHEVESYWKQCDMTWCRDAYSMTHIRSMLSDIAKHFFELGMQQSKNYNNNEE